MPAEGVRRRPLGFEVEELAALVAQVRHDDEQQADERKRQGGKRSGRKGHEHAAGERFGAQVGEQGGVRPDVERVERRPAKRSCHCVLAACRCGIAAAGSPAFM